MSKKPFKKKDEIFITLHNHLIKKWHQDFQNKNIKLGYIEKWNNLQKETFDKKQRKFEIINNEIFCLEKCLVCQQFKPVTPLYFFYKNSEKEYESGKEIVHNSLSKGCRECFTKINRSLEVNTKEYIRKILSKYSKLDINWYQSIPNICAISNISLVEKSNSDWRLSIQNNIAKDIKHDIKKNKKGDDHLPEYCIKIALEFNVAEYKIIKKDLITTYKEEVFPYFLNEFIKPCDTSEMINYMIQWYDNSPKENGVVKVNKTDKKNAINQYVKQLYKLHLKSILVKQCNSYKRNDIKRINSLTKKEKTADITAEILFNKLLNQKMKCYYTSIPFSIDKDSWNYWSLERLDNNKNHTDDNTVFICRIFNSSAGLNRKKLLYALLQQVHVPIPNNIRSKIEIELKNSL